VSNIKKTGDVIQIGTNLMELIEFVVNKKDKNNQVKKCRYGINVFKVREVIKAPDIVPLPNKQPYIEGMFNLRNENIPLINLIERLGGTDKNYNDCVVIVAEFNNMFVGLLVHEVVQIHRISWKRILPAPRMAGGEESALIIGVIKQKNNDSIVILDFENIVNEINPIDTDEEIKNIKENEKIKTAQFTVLLADDSNVVRKQMQKILTKLGFKTIITNNGKAAFEKLLKLKQESENENVPIRKKVALIITDIEMPQMDGYTLTKKIKEDKILSKLPVVMHTSLSGDNVQKRGLEVGADAYLTKFSTETVKDTLFDVIEKWYF
jgi:two-component system chemotaxis response regulator CheV